MATNYPSSKQTFTDPAGTNTLDSPDHAALHTDMNDTMEAVQDTVGTTAGTNVLMEFAAGEFPIRTSATTAGTAYEVLDQDDMSDDSDTGIPTQKSTKAYTDSATQTMTNKTLTNPAINYTDTTLSCNVKASAYLGAAQDIAKDSWVEVALNTESYDIGNDFNTTTHEFTAPVNGYYLVIGQVTYATPEADKRYWASLNINNAATPTLYYPAHSSSTSGLGISISSVMFLTATNLLSLYTRCNTTGTEALSTGALATFLNVHLLSI